jgi:hypothetical protein
MRARRLASDPRAAHDDMSGSIRPTIFTARSTNHRISVAAEDWSR